MKKSRKMFSLAILFSLALMLLIPFGSASAYTGGLLDGKLLKYGDVFGGTPITSSSQVTDGDEATYQTVTATNYLWYEFSGTADISSFKVKANSDNIQVQFYNSSKTKVGTATPLATELQSGTEITKNVDNVKYVAVYNSHASNSRLVYEFDVFGTVSADTTPPGNVINLNGVDDNADGVYTVSWSGVNDTDLLEYKLYVNGSFAISTTNTSQDLALITGDVVKVTSIDDSGNESSGTTFTVGSPADTTPPSEITSLSSDPTQTSVDFSYSLPIDDDFDKINVYQDGVQIGTTQTSQFTVSGLVSGTSYTFKFTSVDLDGNESAGLIRSVTTLSEVDSIAPSSPDGLSLTQNNGALTAYWSRNLETDVQGYNVYVDGVQHNSSLVTATSYIINGLENGISYDVTVTAVDTSGNESTQSLMATNSPDLMAVPTVSMDYSLVDVADGTSTWFSSIWLIVAFASAIPLAFYVANRIKLLFVA